MLAQKTYQILKQFEKEELKSFYDFLDSPFHVKEGNLYLLLTASLIELYAFPDNGSERKLFEKVYPKEKFSKEKARQRLSHLSSKLNQLLYDFIAHSKLKSNKSERKNLLLSALYGTKLEQVLVSEKLKADWSEEIELDIYNLEYFSNKFQYSLWEFHNIAGTQRGQNFSDLLIDALGHFESHYILKKLWLLCQLKNFQNIFQIDYEIWTVEKAQEKIVEAGLESHPLVEIYFTIYKILWNRQDHESIDFLKKLLLKKSETFELKLAVEMYTVVANACIYIIRTDNERKEEYYKILFEVYEDQLSKNLLTQEKYVPPGRLRNVIGLAQFLGYYERTKKLIEEGCELLEPSVRESAKYFFMANFHFIQNNFDKALEELRFFDNKTDSYFALDAKSLEIRLFYETDAMDLMEYRLINFEHYIRKNKKSIVNDSRIAYREFVKLSRALMKLKNDPNVNESKIEKLSIKVKGAKTVYKDWLLKKTDQLLKA